MPDYPTDPTAVGSPAGTDLKLQLSGRAAPAVLLAAIEADASLAPAIAALGGKDKAALLDRLYDADDEERAARRMDDAARTILDHAAGRRDAPLDPLAKPAALIDDIVAETLVPTLEAEGFKKKGRAWTRKDERGERAVEVHVPSTGHFRATFAIEVWGQAPGDRYRLGTRLDELRREYPRGYTFAVDDDAAVERVTAEVRSDWTDIGLPLVLALPDPVAAAELLFAIGADQSHLDQARRHLTVGPGHAEMARRIDDRYFELHPDLQLPDEEQFTPLTISIPDALAAVRVRLRRLAGAGRSLTPDQRADVVAFVERCRAAVTTEPVFDDPADPEDDRARRAVAMARRTDRDLRHGTGAATSEAVLADVEELLAADGA